jgi:hypothetical protein
MNLRAVKEGLRHRIPPIRLDAQLTFFLDYAVRPLQDFLRAFNTEERLVSPKTASGSVPGKFFQEEPTLKGEISPRRLARI